jgi:hypothetical protein
MEFELDEGQRACREEAGAFLRENVTPELQHERAGRWAELTEIQAGTAGVAAGWLQREPGLAG